MDVNEIIMRVAKEHHTTPEEVYAEMQIAINAGFQSKDTDVKKAWAKIPFQGERPTPEDVIPYLVSKVKES